MLTQGQEAHLAQGSAFVCFSHVCNLCGGLRRGLMAFACGATSMTPPVYSPPAHILVLYPPFQLMHIALYIYIHYTYYIIFITYVFESLLFWHLNLMCFFYIYLSTDNVQPIINQTMKLKYGKILISKLFVDVVGKWKGRRSW